MSSPEQRILSARAAICPHARTTLAGQEGLEPPTAGFGDRDSSQLSYCPVAARPRPVLPTMVLRARTSHLVDRHQLLKCTLPEPPPSNHSRNRPAVIHAQQRDPGTHSASRPAHPDPPAAGPGNPRAATWHGMPPWVHGFLSAQDLDQD